MTCATPFVAKILVAVRPASVVFVVVSLITEVLPDATTVIKLPVKTLATLPAVKSRSKTCPGITWYNKISLRAFISAVVLKASKPKVGKSPPNR